MLQLSRVQKTDPVLLVLVLSLPIASTRDEHPCSRPSQAHLYESMYECVRDMNMDNNTAKFL